MEREIAIVVAGGWTSIPPPPRFAYQCFGALSRCFNDRQQVLYTHRIDLDDGFVFSRPIKYYNRLSLKHTYSDT